MNERYIINKYNLDLTPKCCCNGPTGPTGPTGPSGGPTGPTERLFKSSNRIIIDSS